MTTLTVMKGVRLTLAMAAAWLVAAGCDNSDEAGAPLFATCTSDASCVSGKCGLSSPKTCTQQCGSDADCPGGFCMYNTCAGPTCDQVEFPGAGVACIDGARRSCSELPSGHCSQCGCPSGQYCIPEQETCVPKLEYGQACDAYDACPDTCGVPMAFDYNKWTWAPWSGSQQYCILPKGTACWTSDPCDCNGNVCYATCLDDDDCP
jgi:hypothetical protein